MSLDLQNLAQLGIQQVQKISAQAATTPLAKLDMPSDSFGGKILDNDGIQAIMKKFDLLIAQANEKLAELSNKYSAQKATGTKGGVVRQTWIEQKKAASALKELS